MLAVDYLEYATPILTHDLGPVLIHVNFAFFLYTCSSVENPAHI